MKSVLICLLIAIAAVAPSQDWNQRVTVTYRAMAADNLISALAEKTKLPLTASLKMHNDIVLVRVKDQPVKTVLEELARAVDGEWTKSPGKYELDRSRARELKQERDVLAAKVAFLRSTFEDERKAVSAKPRLTQADANALVDELTREDRQERENPSLYIQFSEYSPSDRLNARLIDALSDGDLRQLAEDGYLELSNVKTGDAEIYNQKVAAAFDLFLQEQELCARAADRHPELAAPASGQAPENEAESFSWYTRPTRKPAKIVLKIGFDKRSLQSLALGYSAEGKKVMWVGGWSGTDLEDEDEQGDQDPPIKINLSARSRQLIDLVTKVTDRSLPYSYDIESPEPPTNFKAWALDPERVDPLSLIASDTALSLYPEDNLVCLFPDSADWQLGYDKSTAEAVSKERFLRVSGLTEVKNESWIELVPLDPVGARANRTPRKALARLLKLTQDPTFPTLESKASLAAEFPPAGDDMFGVNIATVLDCHQSVCDFFVSNNRSLRMFGMLAPNQQASLLKGEPLLVRQLPPGARDLQLPTGAERVSAAFFGTPDAAPVITHFSDSDRFYLTVLTKPEVRLKNSGNVFTELIRPSEVASRMKPDMQGSPEEFVPPPPTLLAPGEVKIYTWTLVQRESRIPLGSFTTYRQTGGFGVLSSLPEQLRLLIQAALDKRSKPTAPPTGDSDSPPPPRDL